MRPLLQIHREDDRISQHTRNAMRFPIKSSISIRTLDPHLTMRLYIAAKISW